MVSGGGICEKGLKKPFFSENGTVILTVTPKFAIVKPVSEWDFSFLRIHFN